MLKKDISSSCGKVQYILFCHTGRFFSITELRAEIERKFKKRMRRETIANALREIDLTTGLLQEDTRNVGCSKNIKIYSITNKNE